MGAYLESMNLYRKYMKVLHQRIAYLIDAILNPFQGDLLPNKSTTTAFVRVNYDVHH